MKHSMLLLIVWLFALTCTTAAQQISLHPQDGSVDSVWYKDISHNVKPEQLSCAAGGFEYYRLHVSYGSLSRNYKEVTEFSILPSLPDEDEDTFDSEWIETHYNTQFRQEMEELLRQQNAEQGDLEPSLAEELLDHIEDEYLKLLDSWANDDFFICIPDCPKVTLVCQMYTDERVEEMQYGYRLKYNRHHTEIGEEGPPYAMTTEIVFDLEYYAEGWVYFTVACVCDEDETMVSAPVTPGPWASINLTSPRMKPGYPFTSPEAKPFPWIPVGAGVVGIGVVTYLILDDGASGNCDFTVSANVTGTTCGLPSGSATVTASPPDSYAFAWSHGATGPALSNLAAGTYVVTVTRSGTDCSRIANINVTNTNPTFDLSFTTTDANCGLADGRATINVSTPGTYTYVWSNGATGPSQENLAAGEYMVTVSAGGECTESILVLVHERDPEFDISISSTPSACGGTDGTATALVSPAGNYEYLWSNGSTVSEAIGIAAGDYQVTVTIAGTSCNKSASVTVGELPPDFTASVSTTPAGCGLADGTATVTVSPPGEYEYLWSSGSTAPEVSGLTSGTYHVTITIAGTTCSMVVSATIDELPAEFDASVTTTPANCKATDGSAAITVSPPGEYDYAWSNGSTGPEASDLAPGDYVVTISIPGTECQSTIAFNIQELPPGFSVSISTTPSGCGASDGTATAIVDPPGSYTFEWSSGATGSTAGELSPGDYTVLVTDETGCCIELSLTVDETPAEFITGVVPVPGNCLGEGADILITTQTTGDGPMEITATGPDGGKAVVTTPAGATNLNTFFVVIPGEWHLVVRDLSLSSDCVDDETVDVADNTEFTPQNDSYKTTADQPLSGNVLDNDTGTGLKVVEHTQPVSGVLQLNEDGSFTYTPDGVFIGDLSFQYTVMDACGNTQVVFVTIRINSGACTFETTFTTIPTHCGLTDGSVTTTVDPPGEYTYVWSNGATTPDITGLGSGEYHVTVTSADLQCSNEYTVTIDEVPDEYIDDVGTTPGTCSGGGEITISLVTSGDGPLVVTVTGPGGSTQVSLPSGQHNLSAHLDIPSGDYSISVYDQGAGEQCSVSVDVTVPDNTPALVPMDDNYETPFNTPVSGNVLDNDDGLDLVVESVSGVIGGVVDWQPDGSFTFTPDFGFQGLGGFTYTVRDACGNTGNALVEIFVGEGVCDFTVQFVNTNTSCGLSDGTAFAVVDPPGNYFYEWSTGVTGPMLSDVAAGIYSVTIEDLDMACALTFDTEVGEDPAMYISNVQVVQPECPIEGDILFEVSSPGSGPISMHVVHPNGIDEFIIPEGLIALSEYLSVTDGDYNVTVMDLSAGPECTDGFMATIEGTVTLTIDLEGVFPPSEPSSMDGGMLIIVTMPTMPPYTIFLNGDGIGIALNDFIEIDGLGAGDYLVQIQDDNGCFSNTLNVTIPLPGTFGLQLGFGLSSFDIAPSALPELPGTESKTVVRSVLQAAVTYRAAGFTQETGVGVMMDGAGSVFRLSQLMQLGQYRMRGVDMKVHGGVSMDIARDVSVQSFLTLRGSASCQLTKHLRLHAALSLRGSVVAGAEQVLSRIETPVVEFGVRLPVVGMKKVGIPLR